VIVAGRHLEHANATAAAIGHGARGCEIDATAASSIATALEGIATVVSCIDQPQRGLLRAAIERGLRYTDITPHLVELGRGAAYEELDAAARASGARVVLGTGIIPGISNVIVRAVADSLGGADVIETSLLLSASDASGPASFDYFLQELTMPFELHVDGADRPARAFSDPRVIEFPPPFGPRSAYLFPFSDQCCIRGRWALGPPSRGWRSSLRGWHGCLPRRFASARCASSRGNACGRRSPDAARIVGRAMTSGSRCAWTSPTPVDRRTRRSWVARRQMRPRPAPVARCAP
jgi:hypothetical protein